ncbi:MAG: hypothetical protein VKI63_02520 [Cyanobium sp.]|nr:hypothetical protein [Cyanobium sp.]
MAIGYGSDETDRQARSALERAQAYLSRGDTSAGDPVLPPWFASSGSQTLAGDLQDSTATAFGIASSAQQALSDRIGTKMQIKHNESMAELANSQRLKAKKAAGKARSGIGGILGPVAGALGSMIPGVGPILGPLASAGARML